MAGFRTLKLGIQLFAFFLHCAHVVSFNAIAGAPRISRQPLDITALGATESSSGTKRTLVLEKPCFWKPRAERSSWKERIHIRDLKVGQKLSGYGVGDLLDGKTGPKVFFECGVGRTAKNGEWSIVNGMLRLERSKQSVAQKRAGRLRKKKEVELYVSRIQRDCGRLEVVRTLEEIEAYKDSPSKRRISSFSVDEEVSGKIVELRPYGAIVDIGANRLGLVHIQRVADLYEKYIDKEKGLAKAGLERGARVRLSVVSNTKRRLSLDFTPDVKKSAKEERAIQSSPAESRARMESISSGEIVADEEAESAPQASKGIGATPNDDQNPEMDKSSEEDDGDYDEDEDIEDAFGLGFY